jgi:hypothetical protein
MLLKRHQGGYKNLIPRKNLPAIHCLRGILHLAVCKSEQVLANVAWFRRTNEAEPIAMKQDRAARL